MEAKAGSILSVKYPCRVHVLEQTIRALEAEIRITRLQHKIATTKEKQKR